MSFPNSRAAILPLTVVALVLVWVLPFAISPFNADEAYYALGGRAIIEGGKLYVDMWDIKPPLVYFLYALPFALVGEHTEAMRIFELLITVLSGATVFLVTNRFFNKRAALFGTGLYAFSIASLAGFDGLGEAENFMVAPLMLAFVLYRTDDTRQDARLAALISGFLLGIAFALKFSAGLFAVGLVIAELLLREYSTWSLRGALGRLAFAALGFVTVQVAWVGYLLEIGAWRAFWDIQVNFAIPYNSFRWAPEGTSYSRHLLQATSAWLSSAPYLTIPAWAALFFGLVRGPKPAVQFLAALGLISILTVWVQGKFFHYHWIIVIPFLSVLGGFAFDSLLAVIQPFGAKKTYIAAGLLATGLIIIAMPHIFQTYDRYGVFFDRVTGKISQSQVEDGYFVEFSLNRQLVEYIRTYGEPDDTFYIWGFGTPPHFSEDRPLPTRFVTNQGLRASWTPQKWRTEFLDSLTRSNPRFIAIAAGDYLPWATGRSETSEEHFCNDFPEFRRFTEERYEPVFNNGLFVLYDRDAVAARVPSRCSS